MPMTWPLQGVCTYKSIEICLIWHSCYMCLWLTWCFNHCRWISFMCWWGGCNSFGIDRFGGWSFGQDRSYMCRCGCHSYRCRSSGFCSLGWCFYVRKTKYWPSNHFDAVFMTQRMHQVQLIEISYSLGPRKIDMSTSNISLVSGPHPAPIIWSTVKWESSLLSFFTYTT